MTHRSSTAAGCAAPDQAAPLPASVDLEKETVITGVVRAGDGEAVAGRVRAAARLDRRVHRRGGHLAGRAVPVLRRAGHLDAAGAVPARQRRRRRSTADRGINEVAVHVRH